MSDPQSDFFGLDSLLTEEEVQIREWDAVLIPSRVRHQIVNTGPGPLGFLCAIPCGKENDIK